MRKRAAAGLCLGVLLLAARSAPGESASAVEGQWSGTLEGLPCVRMTFEANDHQLRGAVLFFMIHRTPGTAPEATPGFAEPMIAPSCDGRTATFSINHRYAHPPGTLRDPPVRFRFELTGADTGRLIAPEVPPFEMVRQKYR